MSADDTTASNSKKLRWERRLDRSEYVVVVGGLLAVAGLVVEWFWEMAGQLMVVLGVALETASNAVIIRASRELRIIQDGELAKMQLRTAQAEEALERERLERMKLEEKQAPRRITSESQKRIVEKLKLRAPQSPVPIFVIRYESEMMRFTNELSYCFQLANWNSGEGGMKSYNRIVMGVCIETAQNASRDDEARAELLEDTFRAEGIRVERDLIRTPSYTDAKERALAMPIQILVGEKP